MMPVVLVVDATVTLAASAAPRGFAWFPDPDLVAPPLMWSEARSVLHEAARRGDLTAASARRLRRLVDGAPVLEQSHPTLGEAAWDVADRLGLARIYAAEYVALARLLGCPLVTLDADLRRRASRLARVVGPTEL
jgi:predicted nucleic acid-binding protein